MRIGSIESAVRNHIVRRRNGTGLAEEPTVRAGISRTAGLLGV